MISCKTPSELIEGTMFSLLSEEFPVVRGERGGFSPNGDGQFDTIDIFPEVGKQD